MNMREIVQAAGQRNVSAITYHFGSRDGLLYEILRGHGDPLDIERGRIMDRIGERIDTRRLVGALLLPLAAELATPVGRDYLRIVAQLSEKFAAWNTEAALNPPHLRRILALIEGRPAALAPAIRRQRTLQMIMLMTAAMAERARLVAEARPMELGEGEFLGNLADMIVGALEAPSGTLLG